MPSHGADSLGFHRLAAIVVCGAICTALVAVLLRAATVMLTAIEVIDFPASLDYGEGIVVEQAILIWSGAGYADTNNPPHIVFHYPPVYHLVLSVTAAVLADWGDAVFVGRLVSIVASVAISACAAGLAWSALGPAVGLGARTVGAVAGAGFVLLPPAVAIWMPTARVDMLAIALSVCGVALAAPAARSGPQIIGAGICFVLAGFTKQTSVAALAATLLVLIVIDRRRALQLVIIVGGLGAAAMGFAQWSTEGRFLLHIVGYNINRYSLYQLTAQLTTLIPTVPAVILTITSVVTHRAGRRWRSESMTHRSAVFPIILVQFLICTAMFLLAGKIGSSRNYFIEWHVASAVLIGVLCGEMAYRVRLIANGSTIRALAPMAVAIGIIMQVAILVHPITGVTGGRTDVVRVSDEIITRFAMSNGEIISDDMVLLLRAGRRILLEPAIFAELTGVGRWSESLLLDALREGRISLVATEGVAGDYVFDQRYSASVVRAINEALPHKTRIGWLTLHSATVEGGP